MRMQGFVLVWREHVSPHWQRWNADKRKFLAAQTNLIFFFILLNQDKRNYSTYQGQLPTHKWLGF